MAVHHRRRVLSLDLVCDVVLPGVEEEQIGPEDCVEAPPATSIPDATRASASIGSTAGEGAAAALEARGGCGIRGEGRLRH